MKKLMRKAITVLGSAALIGMTVGSAMAAAYPAPFTSNTAIVVGANAAPSDNIAASNIASNLDASADGGEVTVTGGEEFSILKS
jgi:NhaP-type Na+/H+ or K+/H+ antiporter